MASNAHEIVDEISSYLDRYSLKTSKQTSEDLIAFIEEKWSQADDKKYALHYGYIIIGRMTNEYIRVKDFDNMMRWLKMSDAHSSSKKHPDYINNYYRGQCCLECGNETKALEYFNLCYTENPDYIFTRAPFCYEFFNQHLENPRDLPQEENDDEEELEHYLDLKHWQAFFAEDKELFVNFIDTYGQEIEEFTEKHENALTYIVQNQESILKNILSELLQKYPGLQAMYDYSETDKPHFMPDLQTIAGFSSLLSPNNIYIIESAEYQVLHIGFLFGCSWDSEHGLGVMTYQSQVKNIGGADTAFCI